MNSRRSFLRTLAQAATTAGREPQEEEVHPSSAGREPEPAPRTGTQDGSDVVAPAADERYASQLTLPGWGEAAQAALGAAGVLVVGAGSLASPVASYLAAAGVGRVGIVDDAGVELGGLHRQHLHFTPDVGVAKAHSAAVKLGFLNPEVVVEPYQVRFEAANADGLLAGQDLVVDCSNTLATRRLVNAACCRTGVPLVTAEVSGSAGTVLSVRPGVTPCLSCVRPEAAGPVAEPRGSVLGPVAGMIGSLQALAALQMLAGCTPAPGGDLLELELDASGLRRVAVRRRADCQDCAGR